MSDNVMKAPLAKVSGTAVVRGPDGQIKGTLNFEGETELPEAELRQRLGLPPAGVNDHGSDSRNGDS